MGNHFRRLVKAIVIVVLVALFTIFFQRDYRDWRPMGEDLKNPGDAWFYEARTLHRASPGVFDVDMKIRRASHDLPFQRFEIDCPRRTIRNLSQNTPPEMIPPGSMAENLWLILKDRP